MRHTLHIDKEHIKAILAEVGERLRIVLRLEGRQKLKTSPSIAPLENEGWLSRLLPRRFR